LDRAGPWLRGLTGLLLALNLGLFAVGMLVQFWPAQGFAPHDMNADQIRLAVTLPQAAVPDEAPASALPAEPTGVPPSDLPRRCLAWSRLDSERVLALDQTLADAGLKPADYVWELDEKLAWWVYLPPHADAAKMRAAIDEVHALGVADADPVRGGSMLHAVSLGVFPSLDKARQHAAQMRAKGVKGVLFGLRPSIESVRLVLAKVPEQALTERLRQATRGLMPEACPTVTPDGQAAQASGE
jgi:hypothetical protein